MGEDPVSRLIGDMTGVSLQVEIGGEEIPGPSLADMLIAAGEFPDLIYVSAQADMEKLSQPDYTCPWIRWQSNTAQNFGITLTPWNG